MTQSFPRISTFSVTTRLLKFLGVVFVDRVSRNSTSEGCTSTSSSSELSSDGTGGMDGAVSSKSTLEGCTSTSSSFELSSDGTEDNGEDGRTDGADAVGEVGEEDMLELNAVACCREMILECVAMMKEGRLVEMERSKGRGGDEAQEP